MSLIRFSVAAAAAALVVALAAATVSAGDTPAPAGDKAKYVGDETCKKCHSAEHKSWKKTAMAKSMKTLAPTTEADDKALFDRKTAAKLDPAKDYSTDEKCLKCHTTGYGETGGYPVDPKKDEAAGKAAAAMGSVSCEACHGAGSLYVKHKTEEVEKNKDAKFTWEQLGKFGMVKPDEASCSKCHNKDNPAPPAEAMKFEDGKAKVHDHPKK